MIAALKRGILAALLVTAWLCAPAQAATTQIIMAGSGAAMSTTATQFWPLNGFSTTLGAADSLGNSIASAPGTIDNLYFHLTAAPGAGTSRTITIRKNNTDQALTCAVSNTNTTCTDTGNGHAFTVAAGDVLSWSSALSGTPSSATGSLSFTFVPTTPNDTLVMARAPTTQTGSTAFASTNNGQISTWNTTEANRQNVVPDAGTISNLYLQVTAAAGAAKSYAYTVDKNTTAQALTTSITGAGSGAGITTANDTTHSFTVAKGDLIDYSAAPSGTPAANSSGLGIKFVSSTTGNFPMMANTNATADSSSASEFIVPMGDRGVSTESTAQAPATVAFRITGISVQTTDPGGTASRLFGVRVNGSTIFSCTILHGTTACSATGSAPLNIGDLLDTIDTPSGSPATGNPMVSLIGTAVPVPVVAGGLLTLGVGS